MEILNMVLVEGELIIKVRAATLLTATESENEELVQEILEDIVFDDIKQNLNMASIEFDYDNAVDVKLEKGTAYHYYKKPVDNDDWKKIIKEKK